MEHMKKNMQKTIGKKRKEGKKVLVAEAEFESVITRCLFFQNKIRDQGKIFGLFIDNLRHLIVQ